MVKAEDAQAQALRLCANSRSEMLYLYGCGLWGPPWPDVQLDSHKRPVGGVGTLAVAACVAKGWLTYTRPDKLAVQLTPVGAAVAAGEMLKRKDFGYNASAEGYRVTYKGLPLGGAGIIGEYKGRGRARRVQVAEYCKQAEAMINKLVKEGNGHE